MAPSPTGYVHIGTVRTFLFNWLFARQQDGVCLLRIENTDTSREVEDAVEQIQSSLLWLGIDWDGPVSFQLDTADKARELAEQLLREGKAYEDEGAIRFRQPREGTVWWDDVVRGRIEFQNDKLADLGDRPRRRAPDLQLRQPGRRHRRRDHARDPRPGSRLEHADADQHPARARRRSARLRPCARRARERRQEAVEAPRRGVGRRLPRAGLPARGARELHRAARLELRRPHDRHVARRAGRAVLAGARRAEPGDVRLREARLAERRPPARARRPRRTRRRCSSGCASAASTGTRRRSPRPHRSCRRRSSGSTSTPTSSASCSRTSHPRCDDPEICRAAHDRLAALDDWTAPSIEEALRALADELGQKPRQAFAPIRLAVTGSKVSPGLFESIELLGRERTLQRLAAAAAS